MAKKKNKKVKKNYIQLLVELFIFKILNMLFLNQQEDDSVTFEI